jgi:chromosome segregation ATPase
VAARDTLLDLAAELEQRDRDVAEALDHIRRLDAAVEEVRARGDALRERVEAAPAALAAIDRAHAEAMSSHERAHHEVAVADRRVSELEGGRRMSAPDLEQARRDLDHAREAEEDARRLLERLAAERAEQEATIAATRSEMPVLLSDAAGIAAEVTSIDRVSETGREPAPDRLEGLPDWTSRVHAALFVVRGQLEQERERLVREASELGGAVLGEAVAGSSVALVRRRLEEALGP